MAIYRTNANAVILKVRLLGIRYKNIQYFTVYSLQNSHSEQSNYYKYYKNKFTVVLQMVLKMPSLH